VPLPFIFAINHYLNLVTKEWNMNVEIMGLVAGNSDIIKKFFRFSIQRTIYWQV